MRGYKIKALLKLGLEDLTKNMSVFMYVLLPLVFALLYSNLNGGSKESLFSLCVLMNLAMVPVALMGTIIAEEKEKNTLRTLMLNDVKASEILVAKALICMLFVVIDNIIIYFIFGLSMDNFVLYQLVAFYVSLAILFFGAFVGILSKNQMSAGLLSMPFMMILLAPMFISMFQNKTAEKISKLLPTDAMMSLFSDISKNELSLSESGMPVLVITVWLVISVVMFNISYKKVNVDN